MSEILQWAMDFEVWKSVALLVGGWLFGILVSGTIVPRLSQLIIRRAITKNDIWFDASRSALRYTFSLIGAYASIKTYPFNSEFQSQAIVYWRVAAIILLTLAVARFGTTAFLSYAKRNGSFSSASIVANILRFAILTIGILIILQSLGISVTPMLTALGVGGLAVALGLQETLSNVFGGIALLAGQRLRIGDFVSIGPDVAGQVEDITWRTVSIRKLDNSMVVVPNAVLAQSQFLNYDLPSSELSVLVEVGVSYDSDLSRVETITIEVARDTLNKLFGTGAFVDFDPFVRFHTFGSSSIDFTVILRGRNFVDQYLVKSEFIKALHARYKTEGIEIPFPLRTVILKNTQPDLKPKD